jgi:RNA polymerase sigma-70 factor (ECF subfamily)
MTNDTLPTSPVLLDLLRDADDGGRNEQAWQQFVSRYQPLIYRWCRRRLRHDGAEEVTSVVLAKLARTMGTFTYDPQLRFRAWLRTVVGNAVNDHLEYERRRPRARGEGETLLNLLAEIEGPQTVDRWVREPDQRLGQRWRLAQQAMERVQARVAPTTWQAFWRRGVEGTAGEEVAQELGLSIPAVHMAASRVRRMLRQEVGRLEQEKSSSEAAD